ncbi:MAG TPA: 2-methylcitrate dehydratase, partial [Terrimicrobiaceae bacterium]|nr:2-methylcitrate dehydratase [Terrimicrobiaceae bacterium]
TTDYLDPAKRSIGNAIQISFRDGTSTARVEVEYPVGHRRRRPEGIPLLKAKFEGALRSRIPARPAEEILRLFADESLLDPIRVDRLMDLFAI